jgi:hypothetical protein
MINFAVAIAPPTLQERSSLRLFKKSPPVLRYFVAALRVVGSISRIILYPPLGGGGNTASFFTYDS